MHKSTLTLLLILSELSIATLKIETLTDDAIHALENVTKHLQETTDQIKKGNL